MAENHDWYQNPVTKMSQPVHAARPVIKDGGAGKRDIVTMVQFRS